MLHCITLHYITLHALHTSHYITYITYSTLHYVTLHYIYITLHYITLHCISIHYITLHCITLHYITYITLLYIALHCATLHYNTFTLHYITLHLLHTLHTLHYITYITLHYLTLHYITLHTLHTLQYISCITHIALHDITYISHITLHYTTFTLHCIHYIRLSSKSVKQECPARASSKRVLSRVPCKTLLLLDDCASHLHKEKTSIFIFALVSVYPALHKVTAFGFVGSIRFFFWGGLLLTLRTQQLLCFLTCWGEFFQSFGRVLESVLLGFRVVSLGSWRVLKGLNFPWVP